MSWIKHRLKWLICSRELNELIELKVRMAELEQWCCEFPEVRDSVRWLRENQSYPPQFSGPYGSISDFRQYLRNAKKQNGGES